LTVFVDTSAWYALASKGDNDHAVAQSIYRDLVDRDERLLTSSYVLAETMRLIQHRLGWAPLDLFVTAARTIEVCWIDGARHFASEKLLLERRRRALNIVDAASFVVMRELEIRDAFAFDTDFGREGFRLLEPR